MQIKKSEKASLEGDKLIYALMGFVFVLSLCYVALEWTKTEVTKYEQADQDFQIEEELDIQQTTQEMTPPPPPPPAPEVVQEVEVLNVVEDDVKTESIEFSAEDNNTVVEIVEVKEEVKEEVKVEEDKREEVEENVVFKVVETMPSFPGGDAALMKFISDNVRYPAIAQENGIQGRAICQFTVEKDGSISDIQIVRSAGDETLDKEAKRVIKSMPKWSPGKQRGKAVRVSYTIPINFRLQ
ncbi:MAG: energy transducer TonB [Paludibacteraceae bacterium]|jgi:protein TonB|nr:energy transducer TonB [Paludibacteraceae bacterium]